jgi:NADPH-dependent 2,4-dienoyl-CoA reductase/sulfur reductase-like enzyme
MVALPARARAAGAPLPEVVIIGNGITGITAALALRRENKAAKITVISEETELFYSRTALMYVYMRQLTFKDTVVHPQEFYKKNNINLQFAKIERIDCGQKQLQLDGSTIRYDYLLLAPGSRPRLPGLAGENLSGVQGLYSKQDLERLETVSAAGISNAVIVGGGLIGVELAEMLDTRSIPVTFLVRDDLYFGSVLPKEEAAMITGEIQSHGINLRLATGLKTISGADGKITGITTSQGENIACSFLGMTIGVEPRLELTAGTPIKTARGILTDAYLQTGTPGVFAAGDAAEVALPEGNRKVQQLWYTGRMQGEIAGYNLAQALAGGALKAYDPGIYFNSAKFFTLEYQTYGIVPATNSNADSILWQNTEAKKLIRVAFTMEAGMRIVTGFNVLGVRYRHQVCEAWIREKAPLEKVLSELDRANFDPEFYRHFENNLRGIA